MKRINASGLWALAAILMAGLSVGLFLYVDHRFGPETSAFLLGAILGIPFLLIVVAIVGLIYVLLIRGLAHLQERDDAGEIERMRALRELARTNRSFSQSEKAQMDSELKQMRLLEAWRRQQGTSAPPPDEWPKSLPDHGWPDEAADGEDDERPEGGASYRILD